MRRFLQRKYKSWVYALVALRNGINVRLHRVFETEPPYVENPRIMEVALLVVQLGF